MIWLNGGPGCSSEDGALMEIGPYRLKDDHTLEYNDGSWNEFANVMFVDNPVGTGFSYVDTDSYIKELDVMADQFLVFLEKWFTLFPEYAADDVSREWTCARNKGPPLTHRAKYSSISLENRTPASTFPTSPTTSSSATRRLRAGRSGILRVS